MDYIPVRILDNVHVLFVGIHCESGILTQIKSGPGDRLKGLAAKET